MMLKQISFIFGCLFNLYTFSYADSDDGKVTKIYAHYEDATSYGYSKNGKIYSWGEGKDLVIDAFEYQGTKYNYFSDNAVVKIRRVDNSEASGEPCGLFAQQYKDSSHISPSYPKGCDMAKVMSGRIINIGALDLFRNDGNTAKNIERVDFISTDGITAPLNSSDLSKSGHVVTEKSGNNEIKIAAILSLDSNGDPANYGPLVSVHDANGNDNITVEYGLTTIYLPDGTTIGSQDLSFFANEHQPPQGKPWNVGTSKEYLGMAFVSLQKLGIKAGQKYYGFSYFGRDVTSSYDLVDFHSFPKTTGGDTADPYGGVASYFVEESLMPEGVCYAVSDIKKSLYKVYLNPGSTPLPVADKIEIKGSADLLDGEGGAYYSVDGMVYAFSEGKSPKLYTIDPNSGDTNYIKTFSDMKSNIVGASFYGGYFYVIAKNEDADAILYKIYPKDWSIVSKTSLNGDTTDADALAIDKNGEAYIVLDGVRKLYSLDLDSGKTKYKLKVNTSSEPEALSFAKDGYLYVADSEDGTSSDTDKIYKIDLSTGDLIAAAQIPHEDDIDIEGLSCNIVSKAPPAQPTNPTSTPDPDVNAMLLTRGDGNNNDKTNVYTFYIDTQTDEISNFHLLKKLDQKFRSLTYKDGKFYTAAMNGDIYTIDIDTGEYTKDKAYKKIDSSAVMGMDFDSNGDILYSIWSSDKAKMRELKKFVILEKKSKVVATVPTSDDYIDYAVASFGDDKTVVSVGSGAVRFIEGSTVGEHISSSEWCVYGGEYVQDNKGYFTNAESNDLSIYKLDGSTWSKIYEYGSKTSKNKAEAIAIVHDRESSDSSKVVSATISDLKKYEGDSGTTKYIVTVTLDKPAPTNLTLKYHTADGTATRGDKDYKYVSGSKTIYKGQTKTTIDVYVYGDTKVEPDEYFYLDIEIKN